MNDYAQCDTPRGYAILVSNYRPSPENKKKRRNQIRSMINAFKRIAGIQYRKTKGICKHMAVAKAFMSIRRLDRTVGSKEMYRRVCGGVANNLLWRDAYARKAKRPATAAPMRPIWTEREPAALSLSTSPEPVELPLLPPVEEEWEEEVVLDEPEAVGPAGEVPLFPTG
jgi:hypothetical protein